jgi:hypothetical protein
MDLVRYRSVADCLEDVGGFLAAREAEHNLPLGILGTLREHPDVYREEPYLAAVRDAEAIALVAIRTPPFSLVLSEAGGDASRLPEALDRLVPDLTAVQRDLPGALGPRPVVGAFVERWVAATGRRPELEVAERIYRLSRVSPPRSPGGRWRLATEADRALLLRWIRDFHAEALPTDAPLPGPEAMIDRWIRREGRIAYLWEAGGRVVSLVAAGSPTPTGVRIGPVYTPPSERGRGYAGALTAAASQDQLDSGRRFCFLFTDLANPTSNRIYQAIGYEPVTDVDQYRFTG